MGEGDLRKLLVEVLRWSYVKRLNTTIGGNASAKLSDDVILITPSSTPKHLIRPASIVKMRINGLVISGGVPSSEWRMHVEIYKVRDDVKAIIHTHSPSVLALSSSNFKVNLGFAEAKTYLGHAIPEIPYYTPGSQELAEAISRAFKVRDVYAVILKNHGLVAVGSNILEALNRAEVLEDLAYISIMSYVLR